MSASSTLRRIAVAALCLAAVAAQAQTKIGVVLMHGKLGLPLGVADGKRPAVAGDLIGALKSAGHLVAVPEMCWSRRRAFDKPRDECLAELDPVIAALKAAGATQIVVGGESLGGNAALAYGASHAGLRGVIGLAPADDPQRKTNRPEIAAAIARAKELVAAGKGDTRDSFADVNTGPGGTFPMQLDTTPRIYLSFFDPDSASLAGNTAKLQAPVLWIAGNADPTQRGAEGLYFQRAPANPFNRFVAVTANHLETPDAGRDAVLAWLAVLQK